MTTTSTPPAPATTTRDDVASVRVAGGTFRDDLRAVKMVWKRELIRFSRSRARIITSLAQPIIYLFVLGSGIGSLAATGATKGFDFRTFMFPGVIAMTVLFTSIFSAVSIVWDREFGFLREMLVAPVRRGALVTGKCIGGASVATVQGALMLVLAPAVGVPWSPFLLVWLLLIMALTAFVLTALGIVIASRMQQVESFQFVMQLVVLPMFFLSGAVFPLSRLPRWLAVATTIDPLTYLVDPMRHVVFGHVHATPRVRAELLPPVSWNGWHVPVALELAMSAAFGIALLSVAVRLFSKTD
jgi:ABC-2 type transport system permease protein